MQEGSLWRVKKHVYGHTFNWNGDVFSLKPGEFVVVGDRMIQGDMLGWSNPQYNSHDLKLVSGHAWVKVLLPYQGWLNRTFFNGDSMWLEMVS